MKVRPAVVIQKNDRVLFLKYNYNGTEVYGIPGGNPDPYETLQETVKRELKEELTLEVEPKELLCSCEVIIEEKDNDTLHMIFLGEISDQIPCINPKETSAECFEWIPIENLAELNIYPNIGSSIQKALLQTRKDSNLHLGKIDQSWF